MNVAAHRLAFLPLSLVLSSASCAVDSPEPTLGVAETALGEGCALPSMFLVGTPRNFGVTPGAPLPMTCVQGAWEVVETFAGEGAVFHAGAFKFLQTGNFATGPSWGDGAPRDGKADLGGDGNDIVIDQPGRYRIRFDDRAFRYQTERLPSACAHDAIVARGVSSRDGTRTLDCIDNGVYGGIVMFSRPNMTLELDALGRRDFPSAGRYLVEVRESDRSITARLVSPACARPFAFARGTFNGWEKTEMECENGHYALTIGMLGTQTAFKFDVRGDWSENFGVFPGTKPRGDGHFEPARNVFGNDIVIAGQHHVHFYGDDSFAFDRHD